MDLHTPTIELKGIGPKTEKLYTKLGLIEAEDFLYYFPRDYLLIDPPQRVDRECIGEVIFFRAKVTARPLLKRSSRLQIVTTTLVSDDAEIRAVWFRMPYLTKSLKAGDSYVFRARLARSGHFFSVEQPMIFTEEAYARIVDTLQPIYPLTKGLSNKALCKTIQNVLSEVSIPEEALLPISGEGLTKQEALRRIHFPKDRLELQSARKRLVYEEFFFFLLRLKLMREDREREVNDFHIYPSAHAKRVIERLPYALTKAQKRVWDEISEDLGSNHSMNRLVQGDVGSGKTIIALLSSIMVAESGYQSAIMAPTEILATQHFETVCKLLKGEGMGEIAVLLTGSMSVTAKREAYRKIRDGEALIAIGTHALFQEKVEYHNLALVITDEQHRFGVKQRERMMDKNEITPHVLVMSATPIPRTLAIILYGDLDLSVIDEVPKRRLPIRSCVVDTGYHETAYRLILREISAGRQAYVICPLVEESEGLDCENVIDYTVKLREHLQDYPQIQIGYLHGKMKASDKNSVMEAFYRNDLQILVSTTVVEVGVNVPNATVMLIENSERFGLSQLHQLRGRIGRGEWQSYCIFMSGSQSEKTMERLQTLYRSNDGFRIAEEDLKQRGPGEVFGFRQSGELGFLLGDIYSDAKLLQQARDDVEKLPAKDRDLAVSNYFVGKEKQKHNVL